ncbi:MAG: ribulose 1,5-bisphosphate carboxylase large subunit [Treponema sp.]|jgi:ribulose-bisphosphate carboxylase large chain|nr:ribulose 1,5-bisphosphate carboxylase large subunit [Treponema sp.]
MFFEGYDDSRTAGLLSGERFSVIYRLRGDEKTARAIAEDICAEQTVEFPVSCLPPGAIPEKILGRIERFEAEGCGAEGPERESPSGGPDRWLAEISFAAELAAGEYTQFLNVVFGNISIKRGIQVAAVKPGKAMDGILPGPRFGVEGLRRLLGVSGRPLVFSAIKPLGLSPGDMGKLAGQFAEGGVDLIKDDHGLSNQVFAPFEERVKRCAGAVAEANAKNGTKTIYLPNVTAPADRVLEKARRAKELGAGGLIISPALTGFDALRLAASECGLPVFAHPAFAGSYAINADGIGCSVIFGTLMRLAGADATIFPNYGGRFPLTREECLSIAAACREELGGRASIFPCPAGGMEFAKIPGMVQSYGKDTLILIGGGLFTMGGDIVSNCRRFLEAVSAA